ncbi:PREDICTED: uncharacterized protein LOC105449096 [Wasmannia auropunctata]|uniref:uncharacterized protein LOC105449096 n=1 Tax=Wasmannia auropunctata TaxID=64793 RepID=UPI0005EFB7C0|nr:PREDICTED: uncharacterized protein LOC105449096 [Wasmannia auropunctata]
MKLANRSITRQRSKNVKSSLEQQFSEIQKVDSLSDCLSEKTFLLEIRPEIKQEYVKFMEQYQLLGHMSLVEKNESGDSSNTYYLPHHPVIKDNALTSKLRVVFDASARSESGVSLNHKLLVGAALQDTLFELLLKFRLHQYVLTADLEMMYRQVLVRKKDRDLQRILWRAK